MTKLLPILLLAGLAQAVLVGCDSSGGGDRTITASTHLMSNEDRIKEIENNPAMPQDQKEAAIARLKIRPVADKGH